MNRKSMVIGVIAVALICATVRRRVPNTATVPKSVPVEKVIELDGARIRLVDGDEFDAGSVEPKSVAVFDVPFENVGEESVDLSLFRLCDTCCNGGGLLVESTGTIQPRRSGCLRFQVPSGDRPGPLQVQTAVEYLNPKPYPDGHNLKKMLIRFSLENTGRGFCQWEAARIDLGEVHHSATLVRHVQLTEQVYKSEGPAVRIKPNEEEKVAVTIASQAKREGLYGGTAIDYLVEFRISAEKFGLGKHRTQITASTPLGRSTIGVGMDRCPQVLLSSNRDSVVCWRKL